MRKTLLTRVAPPVTAHVVDVAKAIRVWNNPKYANDRVMLLFTNPTDVLRPGGRRRGYSIRQYRRHGVPSGENLVNNAVSVDEKISKRLRN